MQDGALTTKASSRSKCVTTENSPHCRTELRESSPIRDDEAYRLISDVEVDGLMLAKADDMDEYEQNILLVYH
jgi:hypothetical protein